MPRGVFERTPEMRARASAARKGKYKCPDGCSCARHTSYVRTAEHRAAISARSKGRRLSEESCAKRTATRREKDGYGAKHSMHGTPTYNSWSTMIQRCTNPQAPAYRYYGGRGITICDRWRDFRNFLADMGKRPDGMTLDRVDNDGNYEPGNCRWTTSHEQVTNRRRPSYYDRPPRTPECGHPERHHKAHGMCANCYAVWRRAGKPPIQSTP